MSRRPTTTARLAALALLTLLALLAGCAQIPTSGPVRSGRELGFNQADSYVRALPPAPRRGADPVEIVRGFLDASASFEDDYVIARLYLDPGARESWDPGKGITVYDTGEGFALTPEERGAVRMSAPRLATISAEGVRRPAAPDATVSETFGLTRVEGQWRINRVPNGLLLTDIDVSRSYRPLNVYFLDPSQQILVPDPVFVPKSPGTSTALVKRLLRGPSGWLDPGVTSAFPVGTALSGSVPVENGIAEVDLNEVALSASPKAREALSAQLVWTLGQIEDVQAVRITVGGSPYSVHGAGDVQPRESWQAFDPSALPSDALPYIVRDGRLGLLDDDRFTALAGPLGTGKTRLLEPALTPRADLVAGLTEDRTTLLAGPVGAEPARRLTGGELTGPSWDVLSTAWVADRSKPGQLWLVPRSGEPVKVVVDDLTDVPITAVRVARDGTRIALVAGTGDKAALFVGAIARGDKRENPARVEGLLRLAPLITSVTDVEWAEAGRLAVLGRVGRADPTIYLVDLDGEAVTAAPALSAVVSLAAAPRPLPTIAATADGQIYRLVGRRWVLAGPGAMPLYPG